MLKFIFSKKMALIIGGVFIVLLAGFMLSACSTNDLILRASKNASTYNIEAIYNHDTKMLYGAEKINYRNNSNATLETLNLHLYPNAFREDAIYKPVSQVNEVKAYPNGFSSGNIEIKNVKVNNKSSTFEIGGVDKNILIIKACDNECSYNAPHKNIFVIQSDGTVSISNNLKGRIVPSF